MVWFMVLNYIIGNDYNIVWGFIILRFWNYDIFEGIYFCWIKNSLFLMYEIYSWFLICDGLKGIYLKKLFFNLKF